MKSPPTQVDRDPLQHHLSNTQSRGVVASSLELLTFSSHLSRDMQSEQNAHRATAEWSAACVSQRAGTEVEWAEKRLECLAARSISRHPESEKLVKPHSVHDDDYASPGAPVHARCDTD